MNKGVNAYIVFGEWIFKILLLNVYWFLFSCIGLFFLGVFPATAALFATIRQDIQSNDDIKLFRSFLNHFKQSFLQSNLLGYILVGVTLLLLFNLQVLDLMEASIIHKTVAIITYILLAIIVLISVFLFPIYVHYHASIFGYFKYAAIIVIGKPIHTIAMLIMVATILFLYYLVPGFIPVLGISPLAYIIMRTAYSLFAPLNNEQEES